METLYNTNDAWATRNPNLIFKSKDEDLTQTLLRRILSWAEKAKSEKTGQMFIHSDEFKQDLHNAVIYNNYDHSKAGLSKGEKVEANNLWKKYSIYGRIVK